MYFKDKGRHHTIETLQLAYERGAQLGINEVVIATTSGDTALKALDIFRDFKVIAVTHHCGFKERFKNQMRDEIKTNLESKGVRVVTATHALSGIERSISNKFAGYYPVLIIAETLRLLGQGTKVAVEIAVMATDAGCLSGNDIIAIGGSDRGADSALVIKPAGQSHFFDLKIREIICKPEEF
jgi:hypothetical protein